MLGFFVRKDAPAVERPKRSVSSGAIVVASTALVSGVWYLTHRLKYSHTAIRPMPNDDYNGAPHNGTTHHVPLPEGLQQLYDAYEPNFTFAQNPIGDLANLVCTPEERTPEGTKRAWREAYERLDNKTTN